MSTRKPSKANATGKTRSRGPAIAGSGALFAKGGSAAPRAMGIGPCSGGCGIRRVSSFSSFPDSVWERNCLPKLRFASETPSDSAGDTPATTENIERGALDPSDHSIFGVRRSPRRSPSRAEAGSARPQRCRVATAGVAFGVLLTRVTFALDEPAVAGIPPTLPSPPA